MSKTTLEDTVSRLGIDPDSWASLKGQATAIHPENVIRGLAVLYEGEYGRDDLYEKFIGVAKRTGDWTYHVRDVEQLSQELNEMVREVSATSDSNYLDMLDNFGDGDADLYAAYILNIPEIRERVLDQVGSYDRLYRVTRRIVQRKKKKQKNKPDRDVDETKPDIEITGLLESLPEGHFNILNTSENDVPEENRVEYRDIERLHAILEEKARRDSFKLFKERDPTEGIEDLEEFVAGQSNSNIAEFYQRQLDIFRGYLIFQDQLTESGYINSEFEHPETNEKGVLPSFHQVEAMYHALMEGRFGVFDDCGTGKTAIANLLSPLVKAKLEAEGKKVYGRTLIVGPTSGTKAWRDALEGDETKRHFVDKKNVVWIAEEDKDNGFMNAVEGAESIYVNPEQLLLDVEVGGETKKVYQVLRDIGYDHLIVDEVQEVKNHSTKTKSGGVTESFAVRWLATVQGLEHVTLLSGTPMPDNLDDYANIYFMLKPEEFMVEDLENGELGRKLEFDNVLSRFRDIYEGDPRALYGLVKHKTIRRTSDEVSNLHGYDFVMDDIELTPVQERIMDHIFEKGDKHWLTQMRYAALDPRLVNPHILQELDLVGKLTRDDSAKYKRLDEILEAKNGPIESREKVVIFSSMFAGGVTRPAEGLKAAYRKLGLLDEYKRLGIENLHEELASRLSTKFGREVSFVGIDANTSTPDREAAVDNLDNGLDGIVTTTKSGGVSLNFSPATLGVFLDIDYSPATSDQAIARLVRRGQRAKAEIYFLMGKDSIDYDVLERVEEKRKLIEMALDGVELQDEEKELIWKTHEGARLKERYMKRRGGMAIDLASPEVDELDAFETKKFARRGTNAQTRAVLSEGSTELTVAQELRKVIADDPIKCWHDPEFVAKYCDHFEQLSPYLLARAKAADMVKRSLSGEVPFPKMLLADAAGQGILYNAFQDLEHLIVGRDLEMPAIFDRDFSQAMHDRSNNPNKLLGDMCGGDGVIGDGLFGALGKFDYVDNSSISLLPNKERIRDYVLEANRILEVGGHLQLGIGGWLFSPEFFKGMERAGFESVVRSNRHIVSPGFRRQLKLEHGEHFAGAYAAKLAASIFSIFRKVDEVEGVDEKYFLLQNPQYEEEEREMLPEIEPRKAGEKSLASGVKTEKRKIYTGAHNLQVGPGGIITLVK